MLRAALFASSLAVAACGRPDVTVRVSIPGLDGVETPLPGAIVTFLPYDRDRILEELEAEAAPRPHTAELDSLFRIFREPFGAYLRATAQMQAVRRRHDSLRGSRDDADPAVVALADSVARLERELALARTTLDRVRDTIGPAIARYRSDSRRWEDTTYRDFRRLARSTSRRFLARPTADTTDAEGWATIRLTAGRWWAMAQALDPADPNREWYWNLPLDGDTVYLDSRTGRLRPRY